MPNHGHEYERTCQNTRSFMEADAETEKILRPRKGHLKMLVTSSPLKWTFEVLHFGN